MSLEQSILAPRPKHKTAYARTVVMGDVHGDLDTLLAGLIAKKVLKDTTLPETVNHLIVNGLQQPYLTDLEALVIPQEATTQLIFLGDYLDRWPQGYQVLQFLNKIRWSAFGFHAVFLMGNHEAHNFHFFANPYRAYQLYSESIFSTSRLCEYIGDMGLTDSLAGFMTLHGDEIRELQKNFYRTGKLEWDLGYAKITLRYNTDLSPLLTPLPESGAWSDVQAHCSRLARLLGEPQPEHDEVQPEELFQTLGRLENPGSSNWWCIEPPFIDQDDLSGGYSPKVTRYNLFTRIQHDDGFKRTYSEVLPIDWRLISLVWRKHYGDFFTRLKQMHLEGDTLYVHGGLSPQVMMDSQGFGVLYQYRENTFHENTPQHNVQHVIARINRLTAQVMHNACNDYSFGCMSGTEITDLMGAWRGDQRGFTQFGGLYWADFEYLQKELQHERVMTLFQKFIDATGIRRVICGHTRFYAQEDNTRFLQIGALKRLNLDYLNIDNACSRGYRNTPVLNGIELDASGRVQDQGRLVRSWWEDI